MLAKAVCQLLKVLDLPIFRGQARSYKFCAGNPRQQGAVLLFRASVASEVAESCAGL